MRRIALFSSTRSAISINTESLSYPRTIFVLIALFSALSSHLSFAQSELQSWQATGPHITVELLSDTDGLIPGNEQRLAVRMSPDPQWHTYWRNPGDSGEAPTITLSDSSDFEGSIEYGNILWPLPEAIPVAHLTNYGYSEPHLLIVPIRVPDSFKPGSSVTISADLSWLVCKEDCIPGWATLELSLPVVKSASASQHFEEFEETSLNLPNFLNTTASFEINENSIAIEVDIPSSDAEQENQTRWYAFPFRNDVVDHAAEQSVFFEDGQLRLAMQKSLYLNEQPESLQFLLSNSEDYFYVEAKPTALGSSSQRQLASDSKINDGEWSLNNELSLTTLSLPVAIFFAFLGGLILNVMPCVLPILSIKALALQNDANSETPSTTISKLAYAIGVFVCFNAFALLILILQSTGEQLGWGFHMQSPAVIAGLAFLFTAIGLVLLDTFSVGSSLSNIGQSLVTGNSAKSHFFTGLLAVIVASPCTAPFMAAALGVALVSDPMATLLIFNGLALGFALPLAVLFANPSLKSLLPKPGKWMETFKHALAFPMFATTVWLLWVYAGQTNSLSQFVLMMSLVVFSFACWLLSRTKTWGKGLSFAFITFSFVLPFSNLFSAFTETAQKNSFSSVNSPQTETIAFDPVRLSELKNEGKVVFINMTADWCITCKVNEHVALSTDRVQTAIKDNEVVYMEGDWTNKNQEILDFLKSYQRAGVPLYVVYAGNDYEVVLPQVLTPQVVIDALEEAKLELY